MNPVFLVDVDDTLIDTQAFKKDFFHKLGLAFDFLPDTRDSEVWRLYHLFRERQQKAYSFTDFAKFLKQTFPVHEDDLVKVDRVIAEIDFKPYLLPQANDFLRQLESLGTVILWTAGTTDGQGQKLSQTGLDRILEETRIIEATKNALDPELSQVKSGILIDPFKPSATVTRLQELRTLFPKRQLFYIENSPRQVAKAQTVEDPDLKIIWIKTGDTEVEIEERVQLLQESLPQYANLHDLHKDINQWCRVEGALNPGLKETPSTLGDPGLR